MWVSSDFREKFLTSHLDYLKTKTITHKNNVMPLIYMDI